MKLNEIQFYGRTAEDILMMFGLSADLQALQGCRVLDCPGGPSPFAATLAAAGIEGPRPRGWCKSLGRRPW